MGRGWGGGPTRPQTMTVGRQARRQHENSSMPHKMHSGNEVDCERVGRNLAHTNRSGKQKEGLREGNTSEDPGKGGKMKGREVRCGRACRTSGTDRFCRGCSAATRQKGCAQEKSTPTHSRTHKKNEAEWTLICEATLRLR